MNFGNVVWLWGGRRIYREHCIGLDCKLIGTDVAYAGVDCPANVIHCFLCQSMAGCPHVENQEGMGDDRPVLAQYGSTGTFDEDDAPTDGSFVEVTTIGGELLRPEI